MGLLLIGTIGGGDPIKGLLRAVGSSSAWWAWTPPRELRYTFGNLYLMAGIISHPP
jgi:putative tricarboxylic transport membrane protein